jgi:DNA-directed RNA polymerase subunit M/transcription elongation factor TFIIS
MMNFCPECATLLKPREDDGLYLACPECAFQQKIDSYSIPHVSKIHEEIPYLHPSRVKDFKFNKTYERTTKLDCPNKECKAKTPEVVILTSKNHLDVSYLCTACNATWGGKK